MGNLNEPYSYHHFFFPFRWDVLKPGFKLTDRKESLPFDKRADLGKFHEHITSSNWEHKQFSFKNQNGSFNHVAYNEFTYYHDFVRKVIYDYQLPYHSTTDYYKQGELRYYEYHLEENKEHLYIIRHLKPTQSIPAELSLKIDGLSLHILNTGIGILSFSLANDAYPYPDVIRYINEYGRHIYPQFIRSEDEEYLTPTKHAFLANEIEVVLNGQASEPEDFEEYPFKTSVEQPFIPPKFIRALFSDDFTFCINQDLKRETVLISRVLDDRMFFMCWYGNDEWSKNLSGNAYKNCDWWYGYIFGDKSGKSIANNDLQATQLATHTYTRWVDYGTLFGMSRDSFVSVSQTQSTLRSNDAPPLPEHINSIYYTMIVLCLAQRASILKFSAEVAYLGDITQQGDSKLLGEVKDLYKNYIEFVNKIYFREVTSQIQGIELYAQLQKIMSIPEDASALDRQIQELFHYVRLEAEEIESKALNRLQRIGFPLLIMSLIIGFLGMNVWDGSNLPINNIMEQRDIAWGGIFWWGGWIIGLSLLIVTLTRLAGKAISKIKQNV